MRARFCFAFFFATALNASASDDSLRQAYQRELHFLRSQKAVLEQQRQSQLRELGERKRKLEIDVRSLETKTARLQTQNDQSYEAVQELERRRKAEASRLSSLQGIWKKLRQALEGNGTSDMYAPAQLSASDLAPLGQQVVARIDAQSRLQTRDDSFLDSSGHLRRGPVAWFGGIAAYSLQGGRWQLLGPSKDALPQVVEPNISSDAELGPVLRQAASPLYVFESLRGQADVKKRATWMDKVGAVLPAALLALLLCLVAGLFLSLARI